MIDKDIFDLDQVVNDMRSFWPNKRTQHEKIAIKYYTLIRRAVLEGVRIADIEAVKLNLKIYNKLMISRRLRAYRTATRINKCNHNNKFNLIAISNLMISIDRDILLDNHLINYLNKEIMKIKETFLIIKT
jgi:hypothetical protein